MVDYIKDYEASVKTKLDSAEHGEGCFDWDEIIINHKTQIEYIQHERLIHLMVTLSFGLFLLLSVFAALVTNVTEIFILSLIILVLLIPYIFYYYKLENGVQRLYRLGNEIERRRGKI